MDSVVVVDSDRVVEVPVVAGKIKILLWAFLLIPLGLSAQTTNSRYVQSDTLRATLDPVVVSVTRSVVLDAQSPFSLSRVTRTESARLSVTATGTESLLSDIPGIIVSNRDNYSLGERLSVRGSGWRSSFGVRGVQVLVDGLPLTSPDGQTILELVDPNLVRNVQVIRGPSALFWGNGSGGTLYFSTESLPSDPTFSIRSSMGSFGIKQTDAVLRTNLKSDQLTVSISDFKTDGYRDFSKAHIIRSSIKYQTRLSPSSILSYIGMGILAPDIKNPGSLNLSQYEENPRQANAQFITQNAGKSYNHLVHGLKFEKTLDDSRFESILFNTVRSLENPITPSIIEIERIAFGNRNSYQQKFEQFDFSLSADFAYQQDHRKNWRNQQGNKGNLTVDQIEQVGSSGLAAILNYSTGPWGLFAGIRADLLYFKADDQTQSTSDASGERWMSAITPQLGFTYSLVNHTLFGGLTSSFESPTTTELTNRPDLSRGFNQDLDPEKSIGVEMGARGYLKRIRLTYDLAIYSMRVTNRLSSYQTEAGGDRNFFQNSGKTNHQGLEVSVRWDLFNDTKLNLAFTHSDFAFGDDDPNIGNTLPGIPKNVLNISVNHDFGQISNILEMKYQDKMYANNANSVSSDGYVVLNYHLSHKGIVLAKKSGFEIKPYASIRNILDANYVSSVSINAFGGRFFEPAMPRNFIAGVAVTF